MSIRLSEEEAWAELDRAHTGIFTTLQRDGWPISLPMWFVSFGRHSICALHRRPKSLPASATTRGGTFSWNEASVGRSFAPS